MTSLSTRKKENLSLEIPELDVAARIPEADTKSSDIIEIQVLDKKYYFSPDHVKKCSKLLDPDVRFLIGFDSVLPLIYGYPPSCIPETLLDDLSEKQTFLCNLEFLEIEINDALILHLCKSLRKEVQETSDLIRRKMGSKIKNKIRADQSQEVVSFCCQHDSAFRESNANILPLDIIRYLCTGNSGLLDTITIADFKSKNLIGSFIKSFHEYLSGKGE